MTIPTRTSLATEITVLAATDLVQISKDLGGGSYGTRKIQWANIIVNLPEFAGSDPGLVPEATGADADKLLRGDGAWTAYTLPAAAGADNEVLAFASGNVVALVLSTAHLSDFDAPSPATNDFLRWGGSDWINAPPPSISYTADDQSSSYTGLADGEAGTPYASIDDLNALRTAYENLRLAFDAVLSWVLTGS